MRRAKDEMAAALTWAQALGEEYPDKVLPPYSDDAVLGGTQSPTVHANRAALRGYFVTAFKVAGKARSTNGRHRGCSSKFLARALHEHQHSPGFIQERGVKVAARFRMTSMTAASAGST